MEKCLRLILGITLVTFITGCGKDKKLTCTKEQSFGQAKLSISEELSVSGAYVTKTTTTTVANFDDEKSADVFAQNFEDDEKYEVTKDGNKITLIQTQEIAEENKKDENNKLENVKSDLEKQGYTCK